MNARYTPKLHRRYITTHEQRQKRTKRFDGAVYAVGSHTMYYADLGGKIQHARVLIHANV